MLVLLFKAVCEVILKCTLWFTFYNIVQVIPSRLITNFGSPKLGFDICKNCILFILFQDGDGSLDYEEFVKIMMSS